ncbi:MAG: DUF1963 domain-containing protein [Planctomycetota bacterium]
MFAPIGVSPRSLIPGPACPPSERDTGPDWCQLLECPSQDDVGWFWGDACPLRFFISRDDLARADFSNVVEGYG